MQCKVLEQFRENKVNSKILITQSNQRTYLEVAFQFCPHCFDWLEVPQVGVAPVSRVLPVGLAPLKGRHIIVGRTADSDEVQGLRHVVGRQLEHSRYTFIVLRF